MVKIDLTALVLERIDANRHPYYRSNTADSRESALRFTLYKGSDDDCEWYVQSCDDS